jgi:hypothetical protein
LGSFQLGLQAEAKIKVKERRNDHMNTAILILAIIALFGLAFLISNWRTKLAISQIMDIFRKANAVGIKNAKTVYELGLEPKRMYMRLGLRDYKPRALQLLQQVDVVKMTGDGKLYLSEETLASSKLKLG